MTHNAGEVTVEYSQEEELLENNRVKRIGGTKQEKYNRKFDRTKT